MPFKFSNDNSVRLFPVLTVLLLLAGVIFWQGVSGSFVFDDIANVSKNPNVAITELGFQQLLQAWNSSLFDFPSSRPLSMFAFGLNHLAFGMDPFWFKAVNIAIHLACGLCVFFLTRNLVGAAVELKRLDLTKGQGEMLALIACALWMLAPLNVSPVLYVVQRMTSLSALFTLLGLMVYLRGRIMLIKGEPGGWYLLVSILFAGLGFLSKENAALFPGYLLAIEFSLLQFRTSTQRGRYVLLSFTALFVVFPILAGVYYIASHPELITNGYATRPFDLQERLLTESRALWFYIEQLLIPDYSKFGFFHDDFEISRSLLEPWTTLPAIAGLLILTMGALFGAKHWPIASFAVLFFLVGHAMESSVIALEPVFEHRNYLPSYGPLLFLAFLMVKLHRASSMRLASAVFVLSFVVYCAFVTVLRANEWSGELHFYITEAERHPDSPRANFMAGRTLVGQIYKSDDTAKTYALSRRYFERAVELNDANADGLFGLIILNLHVGRDPEKVWIEKLTYRLKHIPYSAMNISTTQFSYLVKWHMADGHHMSREMVLEIFKSALENKLLDNLARSGILNALRAYYQEVLGEPEAALTYAKDAVRLNTKSWHYRDRLVRLLVVLGRLGEAQQELEAAVLLDKYKANMNKAAKLANLISARRNEQASARIN